MSAGLVVTIGVELPQEARELVMGLRQALPAGARRVTPTELRVVLCVGRAPGLESLDALRLALHRLVVVHAPFEAALRRIVEQPAGQVRRWLVECGDEADALVHLGASVTAALEGFGFEVAGPVPAVPLGRGTGDATLSLPHGAARRVPVLALAWHAVDADTGTTVASGQAPLERGAAAAEAAQADRERAEIDGELSRRLARRVRPAAPKTPLLKAGPKRPVTPIDDPDTDGDNGPEGDDDEPDDASI